MRWVQVTHGVTLKSYTFFKPLDLSRFNSKKKTLINANILIRISLIIHHLLYFICISKPKKVSYLTFSLSLYVSLSISFSSTVVPPPWIDCWQKKVKNNKKIIAEHWIWRFVRRKTKMKIILFNLQSLLKCFLKCTKFGMTDPFR